MLGQSIPRFEDKVLLSGQGRFIEDMNLHGQAHAWFVRSPVAHGLGRGQVEHAAIEDRPQRRLTAADLVVHRVDRQVVAGVAARLGVHALDRLGH